MTRLRQSIFSLASPGSSVFAFLIIEIRRNPELLKIRPRDEDG